ncbi:MAG: hypothetical protein K9N05_03180 [Candidatus Marinimicrobia bacterium]|nr:hypothetical protein [Candidatus Neomarinimicrobiota bacterium]
MKKAIVILFIIVFGTMAFASNPVNYKAKLLPAKGMLVSGGTSTTVGMATVGFSYGLNKTNIHAKINYTALRSEIEGIMQHQLLELAGIDMGFSYGAHILFGGARLEVGGIVMWNMSYELASNVAFYGGLKYKIGYGISGGWSYFINRLSVYLGTEIELIKNLKLYIELQPTILNTDGRMIGANAALIGVNYYFPGKSSKAEMPDA